MISMNKSYIEKKWKENKMNYYLSGQFLVREIVKKTKTKMFCNLKVNDLIDMRVDLNATGYGRNGIYAKYITCKNLETNETVELSFNQLPKVLMCFDIKQIL